jgi:diacylglycerol kinase family enzyme
LKNFFTAHPYPFRLYIPGDANGRSEIDVKAFFISIANGNQFGNHFTIAPKASLHDGLLDIVVARQTNRLGFFVSVIRQVLGGYRVTARPTENGVGKILYFQTPSLVISNPGRAPLHIDGDPKSSAEEFRISVVREAIRLIQP